MPDLKLPEDWSEKKKKAITNSFTLLTQLNRIYYRDNANNEFEKYLFEQLDRCYDHGYIEGFKDAKGISE